LKFHCPKNATNPRSVLSARKPHEHAYNQLSATIHLASMETLHPSFDLKRPEHAMPYPGVEDALGRITRKVRPVLRPTRAHLWLRPPDDLLGFLDRWRRVGVR